jgi:hypothetical protein
MIKHIWTVLVQRSSVDQDTNGLTLGEVFESLEVGFAGNAKDLTQPMLLPIQFEIVSMLVRNKIGNPEGGTISVTILDPSSKQLGESEQVITFPADSKRLRARMKSGGFPYTQIGDYLFVIKFKADVDEDYQQVASIPIEITPKKIHA